jgi:hypothetical protein
VFEKNEYYDTNHDIVLFQYFQSPDSTAARVMKDEELNWGILSSILSKMGRI